MNLGLVLRRFCCFLCGFLVWFKHWRFIVLSWFDVNNFFGLLILVLSWLDLAFYFNWGLFSF